MRRSELNCYKPFLTCVSLYAINVNKCPCSSQMSCLCLCNDHRSHKILIHNFFINLREIESQVSDQPFFSILSWVTFMILTGSFSSNSQSWVLLNDLRFNDLTQTLFNSRLINSRTSNKPFISSSSLVISIFEVSDSSDLSDTVSWDCLKFIDWDKDFLRIKSEGFWILLSCSVLRVTISHFDHLSKLSFLFHDQLTFLITDYWISDFTVLSRA